MKRPEWMVCGNCLWAREAPGRVKVETGCDTLCSHKCPDFAEIHNWNFCSNWTCVRCWQPWNDYFFPAVENDMQGPSDYPLVNGNTQAYVNHLKCKPVRFANREEVGYQE